MPDDRPPRITRPEPPRTEPIRSWSAMWRETDDKTSPRDGDASPAEAASDPIQRSVELGYRVVDEYVREGMDAARRFGDRTAAPNIGFADGRQLIDRMAQYTADFMSVWLDFANLMTRNGAPWERPATRAAATNGAPPRTDGVGGETDPAARPAPAGTTRLRLEVHSAQATAVTLDLPPDAASSPLTIHALRASTADLPRIGEVAFEPARDGTPAALRVRIPADHPAGTYRGTIVDARTNLPVGVLSIEVSPPARDTVDGAAR